MSFSDEDLDALLGAYALDAVDDVERREVEAYLRRSPQAREEVREHHEVAMALATTPGLAPDALWNRIEATMAENERTSSPVTPITPVAPITFDPVQTRDKNSGRSNRRGTVVALPRRWPIPAIAAAVIVASFGAVTLRQHGTIQQLRTDVASAKTNAAQNKARADRIQRVLTEASTLEPAARERTIKQLLVTSGTAVAQLASGNQKGIVEIVVAKNGQGYLISKALPPLAKGHTYQLWGVSDEVVLSLGVLGSAPSTLEFAAHENWTKFVLTEELSPGVSSSKQPAFAVGEVRSI